MLGYVLFGELINKEVSWLYWYSGII